MNVKENYSVCKVCSCIAKKILSKNAVFCNRSVPLEIYKCLNCGFVFSDALDTLNNDDYFDLYKYPSYLEVDEWARYEYLNIGPGRSDIQLDGLYLAERLLQKKIGRILLLGSGSSKLPSLLKEMGNGEISIYTTGALSNNNNINITEQFTRDKYKGYFELILSAEVFEHYRNPINEFRELIDLLDPNGLIVGTTGAVEYRGDDSYAYITSEPRNGHVSYYSRQSISKIASKLSLHDYTMRASNIGHASTKWRVILAKSICTTEPSILEKNNILNLSQARKIASELKEMGKAIVLTNGCFDILHIGHIQSLMESKELGDILIVGVADDEWVTKTKGKERPCNSIITRMSVLLAIRHIDYIVPIYEDNAVDLIDAIKPKFYTKGEDYSLETMNAEERIALDSYGASIVFTKYVDGYSSTDIIANK
jgi:rfaE bifunctional protein nucleotidyltransferase chain/domain